MTVETTVKAEPALITEAEGEAHDLYKALLLSEIAVYRLNNGSALMPGSFWDRWKCPGGINDVESEITVTDGRYLFLDSSSLAGAPKGTQQRPDERHPADS